MMSQNQKRVPQRGVNLPHKRGVVAKNLDHVAARNMTAEIWVGTSDLEKVSRADQRLPDGLIHTLHQQNHQLMSHQRSIQIKIQEVVLAILMVLCHVQDLQ